MITREEIEHLAELSRVRLSAQELEKLQQDFASILDYVGQVSAVSTSAEAVGETEAMPVVHDVMREDRVEAFAVGGSREALLDAAPRREGDYIVVRKVLDKTVVGDRSLPQPNP